VAVNASASSTFTANTPIPVYDSFGYLVSATAGKGIIPASYFTAQTVYSFYVDLATWEEITVVLPTTTLGGNVNIQIDLSPLPSSFELKPYPFPTMAMPVQSGIFAGQTLIRYSAILNASTTVVASAAGKRVYVKSYNINGYDSVSGHLQIKGSSGAGIAGIVFATQATSASEIADDGEYLGVTAVGDSLACTIAGTAPECWISVTAYQF
jgi:hypothetical protein